MQLIIFLYVLVMIAATMAGLTQTLGLNLFVAAILASIISVIPFVGSIAAIWGACTAWEIEPIIAIIGYLSVPIIFIFLSFANDKTNKF